MNGDEFEKYKNNFYFYVVLKNNNIIGRFHNNLIEENIVTTNKTYKNYYFTTEKYLKYFIPKDILQQILLQENNNYNIENLFLEEINIGYVKIFQDTNVKFRKSNKYSFNFDKFEISQNINIKKFFNNLSENKKYNFVH